MRAITLYLIMFLALLMLSACGSSDTLIYSGSNSNPSVLVSAEQIGSIDSVDAINKAYLNSDAGKMTVSTTLGGYGTVSKATTAGATTILPSIDIIKIIETVWNNAGFAPYFRTPYASFYKITYKENDLPGTYNQTGLLIYPWQILSPRGILLLTHPTEVLRKYSPSQMGFYEGTYSKLFGYLFATLGYVVVIPDYPGMGDNYETHPYCLLSLGRSSAAMVGAIKKSGNFGVADSKISIIGFSEGGYAALASAYYMKDYPTVFKVDRVASLSGPYDLSGAMKDLMLNADRKYKAPYFLPYVINGYRDAYPAVDYLDFSKAVVSTPVKDGSDFNTRLFAIINGDYDGDVINDLIYTVVPESNTQNTYYGPISITTTTFQNQLKSSGSSLNTALSENTLARSDWYLNPKVMFFFAHYVNDDLVPYANTQAISNIWGKNDNVTISTLTDTDPLTDKDVGSTHAASIVKEYIQGMRFIVGM